MSAELALWSFEFFVLCILCYYFYYLRVTVPYWKSRNVPQAEPCFILGNFWNAGLTRSWGLTLYDIYTKWRREKMVGVWFFSQPVLLVNDLEIIKKILIKDFSCFSNHGFSVDLDREPLQAHLFLLNNNRWRNTRIKLTSTFTSGKLKVMFPTIMECGNQLKDHLKEKIAAGKKIEVKDCLTRFTTDIVTSCVFGIQVNSFKNPDVDFRKFGMKVLHQNLRKLLKVIFYTFSPKVFYLFGLRLLEKDVTNFFVNTFRDIAEFREKNNYQNNDFMNILIQLHKNGNSKGTSNEDERFTIENAAAQIFVFFMASFETVSLTLSYAFYELALNEDIQETLYSEIDATLKEYDTKITYSDLLEMKYLDFVVQETLRKYPVLPFVSRKANEDYEFPETGVKIDKGTLVVISSLGIQWDPEYFEEPEKFDPLRFTPEEKAKRSRFTALAFGEGPRTCIANRFAILQVKVGLLSVLSKYRVSLMEDTQIPLSFEKRTIAHSLEGDLYLKFSMRK